MFRYHALRAPVIAASTAGIAGSSLQAQVATAPRAPRTIRGVVQWPGARSLDAANVFIIETLEGAVTRDDGRFAISTTSSGPLTLIVRRLGFSEQRRTVAEGDTSALVIVLEATGVALAPVAIQAARIRRAKSAVPR